jgi:hypothetical protein
MALLSFRIIVLLNLAKEIQSFELGYLMELSVLVFGSLESEIEMIKCFTCKLKLQL